MVKMIAGKVGTVILGVGIAALMVCAAHVINTVIQLFIL